MRPLHGAVNVAAAIASYAKATEEIGVARGRDLDRDAVSLDLQRRVTNAAKALAAYASAPSGK